MPTDTNQSRSHPPQIVHQEATLLNILNHLAQQNIPELETRDLLNQLPTGSGSSLEPDLEEQIGAKLLLRILEKVIGQAFQRHAEVRNNYEKSSSELLRVQAENKSLQKEVKSLKLKLSEKESSVRTLNSYETQIKGTASKKRKNSPLVVQSEETSNSQELSRSGSRIFPRRISPTKADSTQAHLEDTSFVPDTMQVTSSPGCRKSTRFSERVCVPDTPEKMVLRPSDNIEQCVTPDIKTRRESPKSPLIQNLGDSSSLTNKRKLFLRTETLKENKPLRTKTDSINLKNKIRKLKVEDKKNLKDEVEGPVVCSKRVGKIDPGAQSEIDRKSYQQFDDDFPKKKTSKKSENLRNFPSDTDSDFESPNLLKRPRLKDKQSNSVEASASRKEVRSIFEDENDDDIDLFNSSGEEEKEKVKLKKKKSKVRSENRWGIEVLHTITFQYYFIFFVFRSSRSCRTPTRSRS